MSTYTYAPPIKTSGARNQVSGRSAVSVFSPSRAMSAAAMMLAVSMPADLAAATNRASAVGRGVNPLPNKQLLEAFSARMTELEEVAEDEGISLQAASVAATKRFLSGKRNASMPSIFLREDGCLRTVWRDDNGQQAAFTFLPDDTVQFVLFVKSPSGSIDRATGLTDTAGLPRKIAAFGAAKVMSS